MLFGDLFYNKNQIKSKRILFFYTKLRNIYIIGNLITHYISVFLFKTVKKTLKYFVKYPGSKKR